MKCPNCGRRMIVENTKEHFNFVRRYRTCEFCGMKTRSEERIIEKSLLHIVKGEENIIHIIDIKD